MLLPITDLDIAQGCLLKRVLPVARIIALCFIDRNSADTVLENRYTDLATKCNTAEPRLRRIPEHAFVNKLFWAPTPDTVAHTITSAEMVR